MVLLWGGRPPLTNRQKSRWSLPVETVIIYSQWSFFVFSVAVIHQTYFYMYISVDWLCNHTDALCGRTSKTEELRPGTIKTDLPNCLHCAICVWLLISLCQIINNPLRGLSNGTKAREKIHSRTFLVLLHKQRLQRWASSRSCSWQYGVGFFSLLPSCEPLVSFNAPPLTFFCR